jgi:hypothetical protein
MLHGLGERLSAMLDKLVWRGRIEQGGSDGGSRGKTCSVTYRSTGSRRIQATYSGTTSYVHSASSVLAEKIKG